MAKKPHLAPSFFALLPGMSLNACSDEAEAGVWVIAETGAWMANSLHCALPIHWVFTARI